MSRNSAAVLGCGRTGVGKSSLLNLIAGYQAFQESGQAASCTQSVSEVKVTIESNFEVRLIDTPGFFDTNGGQADQTNMNLVTEHLKTLENGINAIVICISWGDVRLDQNFQKILKYLYSFFQDGNIWFHVCFVVTNSLPYQEDIRDKIAALTNGPDSLAAQMQFLVQTVCNLPVIPQFEFFFVNSKHPHCYPTNHYLPAFIEWLKKCPSFPTKNLKEADFHWQYKEKYSTKSAPIYGPKTPLFKLEAGEPIQQKVPHRIPPYTKEINVPHTIERQYETYVKRKLDVLDVATLLLARLFRENYVKQVQTETVIENQKQTIDVYNYEYRMESSGKRGEPQHVLKGYVQEKITQTNYYIRCWSYEAKDEDIIHRTNPSNVIPDPDKQSAVDKTTQFFDQNGNEIISDSSLLQELKNIQASLYNN